MPGFAAGAEVYAVENLTVSEGNCSKVVVRWGAKGEVLSEQSEQEGQYLVNFPEASSLVSSKLSVSAEQLSLEAPRFRQGQWVQLAKEIHFRSKRALRAGQPGVIRDLRVYEGSECESLVLRLPPVGAVDSFDFSVSPKDVVEMKGLPANFANCGSFVLPGGFAPGDMVFSQGDIIVQAPEGGKTVAVGYGDVGMVFGEAISPESRQKGELLIRFEARQDLGNPVFLSVNPKSLSRHPLLVAGRHVELTKPLRFADGTVLESGREGVVVQTIGDGYEADIVQVHDGQQERSFQPVADSFVMVKESKKSLEVLEARLQELETLALMNDRAGKTRRNVSMLDQNLWALCGFGSGLNISFLTHQSKWPRLGSLSADNRCLTLKPTSQEGFDGTLGGESTVCFDHEALVNDETRVAPYAAALRRVAAGRRVLDIGTGPVCFLARLCLRAGARHADAVESSEASVQRAVQCFQAEAPHPPQSSFSQRTCQRTASEVRGQSSERFLPEWANLKVTQLEEGDAEVHVTVADAAQDAVTATQSLRLCRGLSTELQLPKGYTMLVHEILGDMAGNEDAALVVHDIHQRGLLAPDCVVVPRSSSTWLAPTRALDRSSLETLIHRLGHQGDACITPGARYSARRFPKSALLAEPQALEYLDFQNGPELFQQRNLEFRTTRAGDLDGVHMHLHVDLDDSNCIDVLDAHNTAESDSSWNTLYLRLLGEPKHLEPSTRIVCRCTADLRQRPASYSVALLVGEEGEEVELCSDFRWSGG
ncbi:unnamed protein product [Durusdinium trenchii]|uniref:Uncharacterized protein n=1 Tax=Durusdinium trenchii TaxID=1381693 RepID=A0ABP0MFG9_9DINO